MYQQQKRYNTAMDMVQRLQTWHGVVVKAGKDSQLPRFLVGISSRNISLHCELQRVQTELTD